MAGRVELVYWLLHCVFIPSLVQMMIDGRNLSGLSSISGISLRRRSVIPKFPRQYWRISMSVSIIFCKAPFTLWLLMATPREILSSAFEKKHGRSYRT
jgi:hypothetical protein